MPYIKEKNRPSMDEIVLLMEALRVFPDELGFILYKFCVDYIKPSYNNYKNYIGELNECEAEIKRRLPLNNKGDALYVIAESRRKELNRVVELMREKEIKVDGDLNYVIFKYAKYLSNDAVKMVNLLSQIVSSIRVNILAPYEDSKIKENGDL